MNVCFVQDWENRALKSFRVSDDGISVPLSVLEYVVQITSRCFGISGNFVSLAQSRHGTLLRKVSVN